MSAAQLEHVRRTEEEFKEAGFRVEKVGGTTVLERELPESVAEASRVLIKANEDAKNGTNGHGQLNGNAASNGAAESAGSKP